MKFGARCVCVLGGGGWGGGGREEWWTEAELYEDLIK